MNLYEKEIREQLLLLQIESFKESDSKIYFSKLMAKFPFVGSKIAWDKTFPWDSDLSKSDDEFLDFSTFFFDVKGKYNLHGNVVYIGDGLTDFALIGDISLVCDGLEAFFSVPQHHYFVAEDFSWCICFSMEGYMDIGFVSPAVL